MRFWNNLGICVQSMKSLGCLGGPCLGCHISAVLGGLSEAMRPLGSLGLDDQGVKAPNSLGSSIPDCEVFEMFVHL